MTTETKFTPGPWSVEPDGSFYNVVTNGDGFLRYVVGCEGIYREDGSDEANARLIASAPELYEELVQAVIQMEMAAECIEKMRYDEALLHVSSMMRTKRAALAKARGE